MLKLKTNVLTLLLLLSSEAFSQNNSDQQMYIPKSKSAVENLMRNKTNAIDENSEKLDSLDTFELLAKTQYSEIQRGLNSTKTDVLDAIDSSKRTLKKVVESQRFSDAVKDSDLPSKTAIIDSVLKGENWTDALNLTYLFNSRYRIRPRFTSSIFAKYLEIEKDIATILLNENYSIESDAVGLNSNQIRQVRDASFSFGEISEIEGPLNEQIVEGAINSIQLLHNALSSLDVSQIETSIDRIIDGSEQAETKDIGKIERIRTKIENENKNLIKELEEIHNHLDTIESQETGILESTTYMMYLLAFSFGLTVCMRTLRNEKPIITDQTLVEYGGMSFLILAIIILASGGRIESATVGPLLGTIAGYIFGKSISRSKSKEVREGEPNGATQPEVELNENGLDSEKKKE